MKNKLTLLALSAQKINRQHVQLVFVLVSLAMLVLGAGAPLAGSGGRQQGLLVLLLALVAGLLVGLVWARWRGYPYWVPELQHLWLVFVAFLPQFIVIYIPNTRSQLDDWLVAGFLLASQILLLGFAWLNRRISGMPILIIGVALNLLVMVANYGFMPISPQTVSHLVSENSLADIPLGSRIGPKDILLRPQNTRFEWLADRFLTPAWFLYRAAFSLGDVFIAIGAFWMLAKPGLPMQLIINRGAQK